MRFRSFRKEPSDVWKRFRSPESRPWHGGARTGSVAFGHRLQFSGSRRHGSTEVLSTADGNTSLQDTGSGSTADLDVIARNTAVGNTMDIAVHIEPLGSGGGNDCDVWGVITPAS